MAAAGRRCAACRPGVRHSRSAEDQLDLSAAAVVSDQSDPMAVVILHDPSAAARRVVSAVAAAAADRRSDRLVAVSRRDRSVVEASGRAVRSAVCRHGHSAKVVRAGRVLHDRSRVVRRLAAGPMARRQCAGRLVASRRRAGRFSEFRPAAVREMEVRPLVNHCGEVTLPAVRATVAAGEVSVAGRTARMS